MEIRITTLSENTATQGFLAEWGLSILIEVNGTKVLMDTGMSMSAAYNAQLHGIDLRDIQTVVLSHGHHDHTGGLRDVLRRKRGAVAVVGHPDIWSSKYARSQNRDDYCGIPFAREPLESLGARFQLSRKPVHVAEHVMTTGEIPMVTDYETIEDNLFVKEGAELVPDLLADDLGLIIQADLGLVVVLGCAHRGIVNTVRHAQELTGQERVYAVIGGTHLFRASEERITRTAADLKKMEIQKLGVSHCTGFFASSRLADEFGNKFFLNNAGTTLTLP